MDDHHTHARDTGHRLICSWTGPASHARVRLDLALADSDRDLHVGRYAGLLAAVTAATKWCADRGFRHSVDPAVIDRLEVSDHDPGDRVLVVAVMTV